MCGALWFTCKGGDVGFDAIVVGYGWIEVSVDQCAALQMSGGLSSERWLLYFAQADT